MFIIPHLLYEDDEERTVLRYLDQKDPLFWEIRQQRSKYSVSASEVPALCGFGGSTTRGSLWRQKALDIKPSHTAYALELMRNGTEREPEARQYLIDAYEFCLYTTGMWVHPLDQRISASPDAVAVTEQGLVPVEIKSPDMSTIITLEREHKDTLQLQTQIQCMGAAYGYLYYYYSADDERNRLIWVPSSRTQWTEIVALVDDFLGYVSGHQPPPTKCTDSERTHIIKRYQLKYAQFTSTLSLIYCGRPALTCAKDRNNRGDQASAASAIVELKGACKATNKRGAPQESGKDPEAAAKRTRPSGGGDEWPHAKDSGSGGAGSQ